MPFARSLIVDINCDSQECWDLKPCWNLTKIELSSRWLRSGGTFQCKHESSEVWVRDFPQFYFQPLRFFFYSVSSQVTGLCMVSITEFSSPVPEILQFFDAVQYQHHYLLKKAALCPDILYDKLKNITLDSGIWSANRPANQDKPIFKLLLASFSNWGQVQNHSYGYKFYLHVKENSFGVGL